MPNAPPPLRCPLCDHPTRAVAIVAEAGDRRAYGCAACLAESQRVAREVRTRGLGPLAAW